MTSAPRMICSLSIECMMSRDETEVRTFQLHAHAHDIQFMTRRVRSTYPQCSKHLALFPGLSAMSALRACRTVESREDLV